MVTDPGTTPSQPLDQVIFGSGVAAIYGLLMVNHIVFGLFFALTTVCILRGLNLYFQNLVNNWTSNKVLIPVTTTGGEV
jgi:hypothetical protein